MIDDPFGAFFGMPGKNKQNASQKKSKGILKELKITLEQAYQGKPILYKNTRMIVCQKCEGKGGQNTNPCTACKATGVTQKMMMIGPGMYQHMTAPCESCHGEGNLCEEKDICENCKGKKTVEVESELEVLLEAGVPDDYEMKFEGQGFEEVFILCSILLNEKNSLDYCLEIFS